MPGGPCSDELSGRVAHPATLGWSPHSWERASPSPARSRGSCTLRNRLGNEDTAVGHLSGVWRMATVGPANSLHCPWGWVSSSAGAWWAAPHWRGWSSVAMTSTPRASPSLMSPGSACQPERSAWVLGDPLPYPPFPAPQTLWPAAAALRKCRMS